MIRPSSEKLVWYRGPKNRFSSENWFRPTLLLPPEKLLGTSLTGGTALMGASVLAGTAILLGKAGTLPEKVRDGRPGNGVVLMSEVVVLIGKGVV